MDAPSHPPALAADINECRQRVCRIDQQCKNTRGGYTCMDLCPSGMTKVANGTCIGERTQLFHKCCLLLSTDDVFRGLPQTWTSVETGRISADTIRSARIRGAATTAPAHVDTDPKAWGAPASVRPSRPVKTRLRNTSGS